MVYTTGKIELKEKNLSAAAAIGTYFFGIFQEIAMYFLINLIQFFDSCVHTFSMGARKY
jgi:hypothetical protein